MPPSPARPKCLPSWQRDALTGAPLESGTLRMVMREYDPARAPAYDAKARRVVTEPIPYAIHNHRDEQLDEPGISQDRLGSFEFSGSFQRYLRAGERNLPTPERVRRQRWVRWYEVRGVQDWLQERFVPEEISAVMQVMQGADWVETAEGLGKTTGWLTRLEARMARMVRREFLLAD